MITADNVTVLYKTGRFAQKLKALDGFSLSIAEGDVMALLGPNGAGKSTAMYCFLGLIQPDGGTVEVCGQRPTPGSDLFREIAYLPEEPHYHDYLTVREAVTYYATLLGEGKQTRRIDEAIERVGLAEYRDLRVGQCSKGMKQKVGIAHCLIVTPRLVFLDEPTRGLDPVMVREFRNIILDLKKEGATFVINTHVLSEIETVCSKVAIIKKGRVIRTDNIQNIQAIDQNIYEVAFSPLALPPAFIMRAELKGEVMTGEIPAVMLGDFMRSIEASGATLYSCSFKRVSLEDAFFQTVQSVN